MSTTLERFLSQSEKFDDGRREFLILALISTPSFVHGLGTFLSEWSDALLVGTRM